MTRTGSSGSNRFGEDRVFTVAEEIVGYGALPWGGKEIAQGRKWRTPMGSVQYSVSTRRIVG